MFEKASLDQATFPPLDFFANPLRSQNVIRITFPEFTCLCPKTGYPDFAHISLFYIPNKLCVELKAWKLYLNSFRMVGAFHEAVVQHILDRFVLGVEPIWACIVGDFIPRGNVDTLVIVESIPRPAHVEYLFAGLRPRCRGIGDA